MIDHHLSNGTDVIWSVVPDIVRSWNIHSTGDSHE
jgi:hypothetical protein